MRKSGLILLIFVLAFCQEVFCQKVPTGNAKDFKVKTCLHSVSYAGFWRMSFWSRQKNSVLMG
jgi:hypothetical protein